MLLFTMRNFHNAATCESGRMPSRKSVYFGISKPILFFQYFFHVPCTALFTMHFHVTCTVFFTVDLHIVLHMFGFLCF